MIRKLAEITKSNTENLLIHPTQDGLISIIQLIITETCTDLLKMFGDTVLIFESEQVPTLHRVIERMYTLNKTSSDFSSQAISLDSPKPLSRILQLRQVRQVVWPTMKNCKSSCH